MYWFHFVEYRWSVLCSLRTRAYYYYIFHVLHWTNKMYIFFVDQSLFSLLFIRLSFWLIINMVYVNCITSILYLFLAKFVRANLDVKIRINIVIIITALPYNVAIVSGAYFQLTVTKRSSILFIYSRILSKSYSNHDSIVWKIDQCPLFSDKKYILQTVELISHFIQETQLKLTSETFLGSITTLYLSCQLRLLNLCILITWSKNFDTTFHENDMD